MLNRSGITSTNYGNVKQILANVDLQASVGCIVPQSIGTDVGSKKIAKAGTPIAVNFANLQADVAAAVGPTASVFTLQNTTAFAADEKLTIEGVDYTCAATEDVAGKKFAGANAAAQVTSLLKISMMLQLLLEQLISLALLRRLLMFLIHLVLLFQRQVLLVQLVL